MGTSTPTSTDRGSEVRRRMVAAAVEPIPEVGWRTVSTRVVDQRAGVGPGLVHYHLGSVQSLLRQAVVAVTGDAMSELEPVLSDARSADAPLGSRRTARRHRSRLQPC